MLDQSTLGGMFGSSGGQTASPNNTTGTGNATGKGASTATATIEGDITGIQFDQKTLIVLGVSVAAVVLSAIGLFILLLRR